MLADTYINHLYGQDLEGFIQVMQFNNNQVIKIINTEYKGIKEIVQRFEQKPNTFITPNSFYKPDRKRENIRHFRALYIDLDLKLHSKTEAFYQVYLLASEGKIPKPTMIIDSGRGLHIYWRIEHAPKQANYTWQLLEDYLYSELKHLGADLQATDSTRIMRLPSTINTKNNAICKVLEINDLQYSMYDLREKYLKYTKPNKPKSNKIQSLNSKKSNVSMLLNRYTLHIARSQDLIKICELREFEVEGYRNFILHCFAYWQALTIRDKTLLKEVVQGLNSRFKKPLSQTEVNALIRSIKRTVDKFIDYEQGKAKGKDKRVSKQMKNNGGYWYSNKRLIEAINITEQEQRYLKTIIGKQEKYRRNNKRRRQERRNEQGLTSREQQRLDTISHVKKLAEQGYNNSEIARRLDITRVWVSNIVNQELE